MLIGARRKILAGTVLAAAAVGALALAVPAYAAPITGTIHMTVDLSTPGVAQVEVVAQNTSSVRATGWAEVSVAGSNYRFGNLTVTPGATWTFSDSFEGYDCDDVATFSGTAYARETGTSEVTWTTGTVTYPSSYLTIIGCEPTPTQSPTASPAPTESPTPTASPTASPTPTATATNTAVPSPSSTSSAGGLAVTGGPSLAFLGAGALLAVGVIAAGTILKVRRKS